MLRPPLALPLLLTLFSACSEDSADSGTGSGGGNAGGASGGLAGSAGSGAGKGGNGGFAGSEGGSAGKGGSAGSGGSSAGSSGSGGTATGPTKTYVYIGSGAWSGTDGKVHAFAFDQTTAALTPIEDEPAGMLDSFIAVSPDQRYLYAADEAGQKLRAYSIDQASGELTFLNELTPSGHPVYAAVDQGGKFLLVAYYNEGGVEVFSLAANGNLQASVDTESTGTYAHSIVLSPENTTAFVPNKGSNNVSVLSFDPSSGALGAQSPVTQAGGPRHLTFHPDGAHAYLVNELDSTITGFDYAAGALTAFDTYDNFEPAFSGTKSGADIHVTPDGTCLYATNRSGDDSTISMFSIAGDGTLTSVGFEDTRGQTPRNFSIHPSGKHLLLGNHDSNNVASFGIESDCSLTFIESPTIGAAAYWVGFVVLPDN